MPVSHSVVSDPLRPHRLYSPQGSSVHVILQARILEWVAIPFSRRSSQPRDRTWLSRIDETCISISEISISDKHTANDSTTERGRKSAPQRCSVQKASGDLESGPSIRMDAFLPTLSLPLFCFKFTKNRVNVKKPGPCPANEGRTPGGLSLSLSLSPPAPPGLSRGPRRGLCPTGPGSNTTCFFKVS